MGKIFRPKHHWKRLVVSELGVVSLLSALGRGRFSHYIITYMPNIMYSWLLKERKAWKKK